MYEEQINKKRAHLPKSALVRKCKPEELGKLRSPLIPHQVQPLGDCPSTERSPAILGEFQRIRDIPAYCKPGQAWQSESIDHQIAERQPNSCFWRESTGKAFGSALLGTDIASQQCLVSANCPFDIARAHLQVRPRPRKPRSSRVPSLVRPATRRRKLHRPPARRGRKTSSAS